MVEKGDFRTERQILSIMNQSFLGGMYVIYGSYDCTKPQSDIPDELGKNQFLPSVEYALFRNQFLIISYPIGQLE
jgi:hypothetical protein